MANNNYQFIRQTRVIFFSLLFFDSIDDVIASLQTSLFFSLYSSFFLFLSLSFSFSKMKNIEEIVQVDIKRRWKLNGIRPWKNYRKHLHTHRVFIQIWEKFSGISLIFRQFVKNSRPNKKIFFKCLISEYIFIFQLVLIILSIYKSLNKTKFSDA